MNVTTLDAAWQAAEDALPEWWHIRSLILMDPYKKPTWEVVAAEASAGGRRIERGRGSTPVLALQSLVTALTAAAS